MWERIKAFLKRKDVEVSVKRYGIDALGAMAQGLFCSLLIGTILNTLGTQLHIGFLTNTVATVSFGKFPDSQNIITADYFRFKLYIHFVV